MAHRAERRPDEALDSFGPAIPGETIVYGSGRPGYPLAAVEAAVVDRWIAAVQAARMRRVLCLLASAQLAAYDGLLDAYRSAFGPGSVAWAPIADYRLADPPLLLGTILPFLFAARSAGEPVVVHCSAGRGRTGHVLAAWAVSAHGMSNDAAIAAVRRMGREPRESGDPALDALLDACRARFTPGHDDEARPAGAEAAPTQ